MATKAQKVRLSIFLISAAAIFALFFILLIGSKFLRKMDIYYIVYQDISITGLEPGAAVRLNGVPVGRVTGLDVQTAEAVRVKIEIKPGTPIKKDTQAVLNFLGVTGLKYVELTGGTEASAPLPPGGTISAGKSILDTLSGQADVILSKLEMALNNVNHMTSPQTTQVLQSALVSFAGVAAQLDTLFQFTRPDIVKAISTLDSTSVQLYATSKKADALVARVNTILTSSDVEQTISNTRHITDTVRTQLDSLQLVQLSHDVHTLLINTNEMVTHYDLLVLRGRDDILRALRNMEEAVDNLREATDIIRENPSVLIRGRGTPAERIE
jgi:phospholipid/cholesterol/gamma-HCH transport system substrate-binding protein